MDLQKLSKVLVAVWCVASFFIFGYLNFKGQRIADYRDYNGASKSQELLFNSPDEAVNFWSAKQIFAGKPPVITPSQHVKDYKYLDPRSTFLLQGKIAPSGFLGFPFLAGILSAIFESKETILWLTPGLAALGILALYFLILKFFGQKIALLVFLTSTFFPPVLYYSNRGMFNNIPFVSFWLIGWALLIYGMEKSGCKETLFFAASFASFALSIFMRPSEAMWVLAGIILFFILARRKIPKSKAIIFILFFCVAALLYFPFHAALLGLSGMASIGGVAGVNPIGYTVSENINQGIGSNFFDAIFPFGINLRNIFFNLYHVFVLNLYWIMIPAFLGGILWSWKLFSGKTGAPSRASLFFFISLKLSFFWLVLVYGSFKTFDTAGNPTAFTIGDAHFRYWLPIFIFLLPFTFYFFDELDKAIKKRFENASSIANGFGAAIFLTYISLYGIFSISNVWGGLDGIKNTAANLESGKIILDVMSGFADENDLVIVDREDKFVFGRYNVTRRYDFESIKNIMESGANVYIIVALKDSNWEENDKKLKENGLFAQMIGDFENHDLYEIKSVYK